MNAHIKYAAAILSCLILAGCGGTDDTVMESETAKKEVSEVIATEETAVSETSSSETEDMPVETVTSEIQTTFEETVAPETVTTAVNTSEITATETTVPETTAAETVPALTDAPVQPDTVTPYGYPITVIDGVTYVNGILIANKTYSLPDTYAPGGLTDDTYAAYIQMQSAAAAEGLNIFCKSGYRSYWDQYYIYNGYVARDGQALADTYSARAGHSEHQTGMAIDINSTYTSFADTPEGVWLRNNCHKFGFIIRYPEGKEHITGYMYEPWHVRYVGIDAATAITESGLCLEEFYGITSVYS